MNDILMVVAILLANSLLNIVTWMIILGKAGSELQGLIQSVKSTIETIKGEHHDE